MIKFTQGQLRNMEGDAKDIVVKSAAPNTLKDMLVGGAILLVGIIYLTKNAFKNGAKKFEAAEYQTMVDLGIIEESE